MKRSASLESWVNKTEQGFTLIEALVGLCVFSLMLAMATPLYSEWIESSLIREEARAVAMLTKEGRSLAISQNLEHRLEFDLDSNCYRLTHGNRPNNSTDSAWENNVVTGWHQLPDHLGLVANKECDRVTGMDYQHFNGGGSGNTGYICIDDRRGGETFRVGVPYRGTGHVVVHSRAAPGANWQ